MPAVTVDDLTTLQRIEQPAPAARPRRVRSVTTAPNGLEGEGFPVRRAFHGISMADLDPFVHMDQMGEVLYAPGEPKGTPWHPHRGFETVTYMLAGRMRHRDNAGNEGLLGPGSVQWMTAGRGIVHSEMPEQENGLMWGFQLWVNLPAKDKMIAPRYQDIAPDRVPEAVLAGGIVARVLAGQFAGVAGPVEGIVTEPLLLDLALAPGGSVAVPVPRGHNAFVYAFEGEATVGAPATALPRGSAAVLGAGDVALLGGGAKGGRVLLAAARPLNEPVARYGPFVMNDAAGIRQAVADYQAGRF
jgi:redox-sensitive bicupin YhaK (pirin superfamily)